MALILKDRVKENTNTVGTGAVTLTGTFPGYQAFSVIGNANTTYYAIVSQVANEWEVGIGTYTLVGTSVARDTVLSSSSLSSIATISSISQATTTVTVNTAAAHGITAGQVITVNAIANATALVSGATVTILTVGTTNFVAIGAASNTVGVSFTATGAGTGADARIGDSGRRCVREVRREDESAESRRHLRWSRLSASVCTTEAWCPCRGWNSGPCHGPHESRFIESWQSEVSGAGRSR